MSGTPTPRSSSLRRMIGHGRRGGVVVDRDAHQLGAGVRQRRDLEGSRVRRPRCRCWSSTGRRPGWPDPTRTPADVHGDVCSAGLPALDALTAHPPTSRRTSNSGDPDQEGHQADAAGEVDVALQRGRDALAGEALRASAISTRPPSSGGSGSDVDDREVRRQHADEPQQVDRRQLGAERAHRVRPCPPGPGPAGWSRLRTRSWRPRRMSVDASMVRWKPIAIGLQRARWMSSVAR